MAENISHLALSHINPGITYCIYTLPHGIQSFGEKKVLMAFLSVGNVQKNKVGTLNNEHQMLKTLEMGFSTSYHVMITLQ